MIRKDTLRYIITEWNICSEYSTVLLNKIGTTKYISHGISRHDQDVIKDMARELWVYRYPNESVPKKGVK